MKDLHKTDMLPIDYPFSGNIYVMHAFDIGDDIHLDAIEKSRAVITRPFMQPKYFKQYHIPLSVELPHPNLSGRNISCRLHNFGTISLVYKVPFEGSLAEVGKEVTAISEKYQHQSIVDAQSVYKRIEKYITKPAFFPTRSSYVVLQVNPIPDKITVQDLEERFGGLIASTLRFESETLSEDQKNEILKDAIGYFRGDLIVIDTDAAFVYDKEYEEILDFFEFGNIQQLELRYFDHLLDMQLNKIYEGKVSKPPLRAYLPFIGTPENDPIEELGKLKVVISVITERLEGSIRTSGEPYFSELYALLVEKLDLIRWRNAIDRKLSIIHDVQSIYQKKIDTVHEDILSVLIIILILIELIIGILGYIHK